MILRNEYKKRLIFHLLSHQYDQQFEQKYENKREKSGSKVENSLELMLSQCCESSLTCSSPPRCREKRGETRADRENLSENESWRTNRHGAKTRERETAGRSKVP